MKFNSETTTLTIDEIQNVYESLLPLVVLHNSEVVQNILIEILLVLHTAVNKNLKI